MPDLPAGFVWPTHRWPLAEVAGWPDFTKDEVREARAAGQVYDEGEQLVMPLAYLAQIDLAAITACDIEQQLPNRGQLIFFASLTTDIDDARYAKPVASAVRHVACARDQLRLTPQPSMPDPAPEGVLPLRAELRIGLSSDWEDAADAGELPEEADRALEQTYRDCHHALLPAPSGDIVVARMPPPGEVALARFYEEDSIGLCIGDASWVTFVLGGPALEQRRFGEACAGVHLG